MIWIKLEDSISEVTRCYMETIGKALEMNGHQCTYVSSLDKIQYKKGDCIVVNNAMVAIKVLIKGYKYIYWAQGVWPEESLMRNGNKLRSIVATVLEKLSLKHADYVLFVSKHMKEHFERKYHINFKDNWYIMPCFNDVLHKDAFLTEGKYSENVFCYVGSTAVWQCFEQTVELYSRIEKKYGNTKLLLLVKDRDYATKILKKYGVNNYEIDYVPVEKLGQYLNKAKFGFVLRDESIVNEVATPTKIATYLAYGIIPIYSEALRGIGEILKESEYTAEYRGNLEKVESLLNMRIDSMEVLKDFEGLYEKYYTRQKHIERLSGEFRERY